jgi:hypothetical protein
MKMKQRLTIALASALAITVLAAPQMALGSARAKHRHTRVVRMKRPAEAEGIRAKARIRIRSKKGTQTVKIRFKRLAPAEFHRLEDPDSGLVIARFRTDVRGKYLLAWGTRRLPGDDSDREINALSLLDDSGRELLSARFDNRKAGVGVDLPEDWTPPPLPDDQE